MSRDDVGAGTSAGAASSAGWSLPMSGKTGTTETHKSSAFLGFTNNLAAAVYIFGDSPTPGEICSSPLRPCYSGRSEEHTSELQTLMRTSYAVFCLKKKT